MNTTLETRSSAKHHSSNRPERIVEFPTDKNGKRLKVSDYYGENLFDFGKSKGIPDNIKKELIQASKTGERIKKEHADVVAKAVTEWALGRGATHFCHWFQPLTGGTAEKHDAFLNIDGNGNPIETLSGSQLMQGEPDASSFPNGGSRSTFEARGYTSWDLTSPMFLMDGVNGKTLCIPTAFVSYLGESLDIKTPLLRSVSKLNEVATKFLNIIGKKDTTSVNVTCGAEQEYFLVDKAFYYSRPDLVMTGRTLFGALTAKNQQLSDHYFGTIPTRVINFMQELDHELYKLGIPAKTRHNEVAPGQFELAQIFREANVSADNNQLVMATLKTVAEKHNFVALLHEKPFADVNGSGKHLNWSMADNTGLNLLEPGDKPEHNMRFLAVVAMIVEAVNRRSKMLRAAIASAGNDHRLGGHEAPPSIISVFLGDTLDKIYEAILAGKSFTSAEDNTMDLGVQQLANLLKDNTDRNRTSPFAFTGNKFEFRAVGSAKAIGLPLSILNTAIAEVFDESNEILEKDISGGKDVNTALNDLTKKWLTSSRKVIFNGDGYSADWVKEAEKRGLPNLKTTADALPVLTDSSETNFLSKYGIFKQEELQTRFNVLIERYNMLRDIEMQTLVQMVYQYVIPAAVEYKKDLGDIMRTQKEVGVECSVEVEVYKKISFVLESLMSNVNVMKNGLANLGDDETKNASFYAHEIFPISEDVARYCNELEDIIPDSKWTLPKYFDMLFIR